MSRRKILIGASIAGHAALLAGVFVLGAWDLEPLDYEPGARRALAVMTPPSPEGGSYTPPKVELQRKQPPKVIARDRTQPPRLRDQLQVTIEPGRSEPGTGAGAGPGQGPGDGDGPPAADPCKEPSAACGTLPLPAPALPELPKPPPPRVHAVTPQILKGLRTSGETAIHPPRDVFQEMYRAGDLETSASIQLCLAADGTVSSVTLTRSTRYPAYDAAITGAARRWRYQPYKVNGTPVPACGMVTFVYKMN